MGRVLNTSRFHCALGKVDHPRTLPAMSKNEVSDTYEYVPESANGGNGGEAVGTWQCIKENPKIVLWTLYANIGAMMIGYDNLTLAVCLSMPAFQ
jgi:hypothetical protein